MLTFDPEKHRYRWNGETVPSVTQVLKPLISMEWVDAELLARAQEFGTAVHLACELDDLGTLDESELDPALVPYLEGWRNFSKDHRVQWDKIEQRVYHPLMRYAGTLDREGLVDGYPSMVDIKSGTALYPSVGPQLAAYTNASSATPSRFRRYAVRLDPARYRGYELKQYTDPLDWALFASIITVRNFCGRHRINMKEIFHGGI